MARTGKTGKTGKTRVVWNQGWYDPDKPIVLLDEGMNWGISLQESISIRDQLSKKIAQLQAKGATRYSYHKMRP